MFSKIFALLYLISLCNGDRSLTLVVDTTGSMEEEIDVIKAGVENLVKTIKGSDVTNYIVVPFNNPDIGSPLLSESTDQFLDSMNSLTANGGQTECPELSLTGIEKALQYSKPESLIFLFTDAYAKDSDKLETITDLCRSTRSKVIILLSGTCPLSQLNVGSIEVYYDVAKACSGSILRFDFYNLRKAYKFMQAMINTEYNEVTNIERFRNVNVIPLSVGEFSKDVLIAVSGDNALIHVVNSDGKLMTMERIFDTRLALAFRLQNLPMGEYRINVRCYGSASVTVYKRNELPYKIGFAIAVPRSLRETSGRPIPGRTNNVLLSASKDCTVKFESIELQMVQGNDTKTLALEEINADLGLYQTSVFIDPEKPFNILVKGQDKQTYKEFMSLTKTIEPQQMETNTQWSAPYIETMESGSTLVEYSSKAYLACKVFGFPQPNITWQDTFGQILPSETFLLEIPTVFISYVTLDTTSNNTVQCRAQNAQGEDAKSVEVYVHRPYSFNAIQTPIDTQISYDSEGILYCNIDAYPEATTKWYYNSNPIGDSEVLSVYPDNKALVIRKMSLEQVGEYTCEVTNDIEHKRFSAFVNVTGLEKPTVTTRKAELILKPGEGTDVECFATGVPSPNITWKYKSDNDYEYSDLPDGVYSSDMKIELSSAKLEHAGVYRCEATNILGMGSADVSIRIHYAPVIKGFNTDQLTVKEGDSVVLPCEVDAIPKAQVWWEYSDVSEQDEHHYTDERFNHRFIAHSNDSGEYYCTAQNSVGRAQQFVTVNVLVSPYIEAPNSTDIFARVGSSVFLPCKVLYGHPEPSIKWEFMSTDSTITVIENTSKNGLSLQKLSKAQEGFYRCIANNTCNTDSIRFFLRIY